jgi:CRISPR-associated endonuclease/helicase Cas3
MARVCLNLSPFYSRLADPADLTGLPTALVGNIPASIQLRRHQIETWKAYNDPDTDVIFDTALTGDGKSLAGQLPMFTGRQIKPLLLYPTNELIRDQYRGMERNALTFQLANFLPEFMFGDRISEYMEEQDIQKRTNAVASLIKRHDCILSNPDLFHLMGTYNYGGHPTDRRENVYRLLEEFDYFIFDEFHIFQAPQIVSVLNILNYQKVADPMGKHKYVFLSATPTALFKRLLANSGFRVREIKGEYTTQPQDGFTPDPIVGPVQLNLHKLTDKGAYAWAVEYLAELSDFYRQNPTAKGVFIVNSVATAKRLTAFYRVNLPGIKIGENTGLTNADAKAEGMADNSDVQLIIATSTVDVGVDFRINLLIFESTGAGTFIQRLGRLGRHAGWDNYVAHALLPEWIVDKAAARFPNHGADTEPISRLEFLEAVRGSDRLTVIGQDATADLGAFFEPEQEYRNYINRWGGLQTAHVFLQACGKKKDGSYLAFRKDNHFINELRARYNRMYGGSETKDCLTRWIKQYEEIEKDDEKKLILAELNHFRGSSPLTVGIVDETDGYLKSYDLLFLLANTKFKQISEAEFQRELIKRGLDSPIARKKYGSPNLGVYVRLYEYLEERDSFLLLTKRAVKSRLNTVCVFSNLSIANNRALALQDSDDINDKLAEIEFVALVGASAPKKFKREKKLSPLFPVYAFRGKEETINSLVFGLNALLAHSQIPYNLLNKGAGVGDEDDCLIV